MNPNRLFSGMFGLFFVLVLLNVGVVFSTFSCKDTDGGSDVMQRGQVMGTDMSGKDYLLGDSCADIAYVNEYVCTPMGYKSSKVACPKGNVCDTGECVKNKATCTDSDGGVDKYIKGTVSGVGILGTSYSHTDECKNSQMVKENACNPVETLGPYEEPFYTVDSSCGSGETCKDGACVKSIIASCKDTDGGQTLDKKGTVSGTDNSGTIYSYTDSCKDTSNIKEYYCPSAEVAQTLNSPYAYSETSCGEGKECKTGACVKNETASTKCTDSDNGKDYYKKGTTTLPGYAPLIDSCLDDGSLNEIYCASNNLVGIEKFVCPSGYKCSDGACVKSSSMPKPLPKSLPLEITNVSVPTPSSSSATTCTDTDGGDNKNKKGTTTIYNSDGTVKASASDSCVDTYTVNEGTCKKDGSDWVYSSKKCPAKYSCKDGECWKKSVVSTNCTDSDGGVSVNKKGDVTVTTEYSDNTSDKSSYEDTCTTSGTYDAVKEYYCSGNKVQSKTMKCITGYSSVCTKGACYTGSASTQADNSGQLKKTKLRDFLLASGIESNEGTPVFVKPWRFTAGTLLAEIFQDEEE